MAIIMADQWEESYMPEDAFHERFLLAFSIKPDLTNDEFYAILKSEAFDENAAIGRVLESVRAEVGFLDRSRLLQKQKAAAQSGNAGLSAAAKDKDRKFDKRKSTKKPAESGRGDGMPRDDATSDEEDLVIAARTGTGIIKKSSPVGVNKASSAFEDSGDDSEYVSTAASRKRKRQSQAQTDPAGGMRYQTTVTKWIGKLAGGVFLRTLLVCGGEQALHNTDGLSADEGKDDVTSEALIDITTDPERLRRAGWKGRDKTLRTEFLGSSFKIDSSGHRECYKSAIVDDIVVGAGDFVIIRPGSDEHDLARKKKNGKSPPVAANIWFGRIAYMFRNEDDFVHVHWLVHGGDTILGETAGPRELFALDRCDDIPLGSLAGKVKVDFVGRDIAKGCDGMGVVELDYKEVNHYFYRMAYSEATSQFHDASNFAFSPKDAEFQCTCCAKAEKEKTLNKNSVCTQKGEGNAILSIVQNGTTYEIDDFVYLTSLDDSSPYIIAQITGLKLAGKTKRLRTTVKNPKDIMIILQPYGRYDELMENYLQEFEGGKTHRQRDCRHIFRDNTAILRLRPDRLDGLCIVRHVETILDLDKYKDLEDTFYVCSQYSRLLEKPSRGTPKLSDLEPLISNKLKYSQSSEKILEAELKKMDQFLKIGRKLKAMDLFSGAGGLTAGLEQSNVTITKWAIEWDAAAAETFKRNFPHATVYNQDANVVLKHAIEEQNGTSREPIWDLLGNQLPMMPKPGEVDFIYGGPPCQDFSRCNQFRKANSIKNSMLATYLSYIDHYRPKFCLLENVQALLEHRLGSSQIDKHKTQGGIEQGSAKFILRALTSMGYQAQFSVLQAAEHGTPQSRLRVFFWGAAPGYDLPKYPEPTNVFIGKIPKTTRRTRRGAPYFCVTVGDAISDLPPFDWEMDMIGESASDRYKRKNRLPRLPRISVKKSKESNRLGPANQTYSWPTPLSEYQRHARRDVTSDVIFNAYSCTWKEPILERIIRIPMRPGASHLDIRAEYDMRCLRSNQTAAVRNKFYPDRYRRLDYQGLFQTCLTNIEPSGKNGSVLHPSQYRVLTVREQARAMGFPDSFTWDEKQTPKTMYKQIGNAVAIPVARALGQELLKAVMPIWQWWQTVEDVFESETGSSPDLRGDKGGAGLIPRTLKRKQRSVRDGPEPQYNSSESNGGRDLRKRKLSQRFRIGLPTSGGEEGEDSRATQEPHEVGKHHSRRSPGLELPQHLEYPSKSSPVILGTKRKRLFSPAPSSAFSSPSSCDSSGEEDADEEFEERDFNSMEVEGKAEIQVDEDVYEEERPDDQAFYTCESDEDYDESDESEPIRRRSLVRPRRPRTPTAEEAAEMQAEKEAAEKAKAEEEAEAEEEQKVYCSIGTDVHTGLPESGHESESEFYDNSEE